MMLFAWNWTRKNVNLVLLLSAIICLALALSEVIRGATWTLLIPVSLSAAACGWGVGISRLNRKQAWLSLTVLGIPGVFIYVGGLARPLGRLIFSMLSLIPQVILWISEKVLIDFSSFLITWADLASRIAGILGRTWVWSVALFAGRPTVDPLSAGLIWNLLLWFVCAWAGWQFRRNHQALVALAPGGIVLAFVLDTTRGDVGLLVVYLGILLALIGVAGNEWRHLSWQHRKVDYAESIQLDTLAVVGVVTISLVLSAAGTPSLSWRDLVDKLREKNRPGGDQVTESLGLEPQPNTAVNQAFLSGGLPRRHLLGMPPEQLEDVVMRIRTGELPPIPGATYEIHPEHHYWRSTTYDVYSVAGWGSSAAQDIFLPANTPLLEFPQGYRRLNQHIARASDQDNYVYWSGILAQADTDIEIAWRTLPPADPSPTLDGDMLGALTDPNEYTVVSYLPQITAARLRTAGSEYPAEITRRYLGLPSDTPERVLGLARELTQAGATPYDRAVAIESYLRSFPYTLDVAPPPSGRDVVDYFLFTAKKGYCDYYATSMVVLARAVGLPARLVVGYSSDEYNPQIAEYIVRQKDAHSWVEIYFSGIGWVEFEPTASQPLIIRPGDEIASEPAPGLPAGELITSWLKTGWRALLASLGGQFLIAVMGIILIFLLWQVGEIWFLHLLPSQKAISRVYSRMERASARLLPDLPDGHTPHQLATALTLRMKSRGPRFLERLFSAADSEIERVIALYVTQIFSAHLPTKSQTRKGIQAWARLRWRLWAANKWR